MSVQELQEQLTKIQQRIAEEKAKGGSRDDNLIASLENDEAETLKKMDEASKQQAVEDKVAEVHEQVTQSFESISVGDQTITLRELAQNEQAYQILSIYFTQFVTGIAAQNEQDKQTLKDSYESQITELKTTADSERTQRQTLQTELTDMTAKRDAAAAELDEAKKEIDRLNSQVSDLRTEIAVGAKGAVNITDTNLSANLGELVKNYNASKPAIYDIEPLDNLRRQYKAKLMETGEEITFGYLEKGKYREVEAEEAARFQAEHAQQVQDNPVQDIPLGVTPPPPPTVGGTPDGEAFPPEVPNDNNAMEGQSSDGTMETTPSVEERLSALEQRMTDLEESRANWGGSAA